MTIAQQALALRQTAIKAAEARRTAAAADQEPVPPVAVPGSPQEAPPVEAAKEAERRAAREARIAEEHAKAEKYSAENIPTSKRRK